MVTVLEKRSLGTHFTHLVCPAFGDAGEIKGLGQPPKLVTAEVAKKGREERKEDRAGSFLLVFNN